MINIFNLHKTQRVKKKNRTKYYKKVLEKCINKIKLIAEKAETQLVYTIPNIVIGIPLYDNSCPITFNSTCNTGSLAMSVLYLR